VTLEKMDSGSTWAVPVSPVEWAAAVSAAGWLRILQKLHRTVRDAFESNGGRRVKLVGHSAGGVLGRLYLSREPFKGESFNGLERVSHLITLGSPHKNVRGAWMRRWVDRTLPGAYFAPDVAYLSVAGSLIKGDRGGSSREKAVYYLYRHLGGNGAVWGDGLVPVPCALLDGAEHLTLPKVGHAPLGGGPWYGTPEVVRQWGRAD
jgi:pimeloyl-ACP methyl ester carboxylesterase